MIKAIKIFNYIIFFFSTSSLIETLKYRSINDMYGGAALRGFLDSVLFFIGISILITIFEGIIKIENKLKNSIKIEITKDDE